VRLLVLQLSEANLWNRHFFDPNHDYGPSVSGFFSHLALVQSFSVASFYGPVTIAPRESFLLNEKILAWIYHDLSAIVHLAREHGVAVMLMTYPPERFSGRERPVDPVIRHVAS